MKKMISGLVFSLSILYSDSTISLKDLIKLASQDLNKNIYSSSTLPDLDIFYNAEYNQTKKENFYLLESILFENSYSINPDPLQKFYIIKKEVDENLTQINITAAAEAKEASKIHFYTYEVENVTNKDVADALSVFPNIKYKYLPQSDMIAYSATQEQHEFIINTLSNADNSVKQIPIKLTIFYTSKDISFDQGMSIEKLGLSLDSQNAYTLSNIFQFKAYVSSLQTQGYAKIDQSPTLLLVNGSETLFKSVKNIPYLDSSASVTNVQQAVTEQYNYKDVGLQIKILPKIKDNYVFLDINLLSEDLLDFNDGKPLTQKLEYVNSVMVSKDKPLLLTGFKKNSRSWDKSSVPIFSQIPLLRDIFSKNNRGEGFDYLSILIEYGDGASASHSNSLNFDYSVF